MNLVLKSKTAPELPREDGAADCRQGSRSALGAVGDGRRPAEPVHQRAPARHRVAAARVAERHRDAAAVVDDSAGAPAAQAVTVDGRESQHRRTPQKSVAKISHAI